MEITASGFEAPVAVTKDCGGEGGGCEPGRGRAPGGDAARPVPEDLVLLVKRQQGEDTREGAEAAAMASGFSSTREGGEESTHHAILQYRLDLSCRGGTARSWPDRGRLGDAEAVGHRSRLGKGNFQPKQHLEHLVEKLKLLGLEGDREEKEHLCSWRKRTVAFKGDTKASSSSHDGPRAGGGSATACVEESAQEDKEQIQSDLEKLRKQKEEILELKRSGERRCQDYLTQTEVERQKIVSEFRQLRRFLKDQELVLLARLGELDREMMRRQEEEETKMSGEISLLDVLICEMEKKLEQPASSFLQDARGTVDRWEMGGARRTTATFSDLDQNLHVISQQIYVLRETLGRFQDILPSELEKEQGPSPGGDGKAFVTLDPDTANSRLVLSRDRRGNQSCSPQERPCTGSPGWTDPGGDAQLVWDPPCRETHPSVAGGSWVTVVPATGEGEEHKPNVEESRSGAESRRFRGSSPKGGTLSGRTPGTGRRLETLGAALSLVPPAARTWPLRPQMWFPRSLLSSLVVLQVLLGLGSAQFTVVGPGHPLHATMGQDIVLPCHLSPRLDARSLEIRWIRHEISETVHHYRDGEDQYGDQMEEYVGRTELPRDGLPSGRLDLRIVGLRPSDDGQYVCTVQGADLYREATVDLEVTATGSVLHLSLEAYEDGGVRVLCRSAGWYPQPEFEDVIVVTGKGPGNWSCVVRNSRLSQEQESSLHISAPFFHDARPWMAALGVFLVLWVVFVVLSAYLFWRKVLQSRELEELASALAWRKFLLPQNPDVVTLDPATAHRHLDVSEDLRTVRLRSSRRELPCSPQRFISWWCLLGREGFTDGRHCWVVEVEGMVGGNSWWAVGVARDSVERTEFVDMSPEGGIWAVRHRDSQFTSLTSPRTPLSSFLVPSRIWVCVDCTEGLVTFINADSGAEIFTFPPAPFDGEIRPWFWVGRKRTQLCIGGSSS
ncbi:uncharacterized protein LOC104328469 isoform X2 [Opisthocomus hoazin]|uniref:uncharacterized protein LOC104328469 isoform X2 n=1 Tax=Opisthocomus hoazin TaxID=30419 RepID=UPI003F52B9E5